MRRFHHTPKESLIGGSRFLGMTRTVRRWKPVSFSLLFVRLWWHFSSMWTRWWLRWKQRLSTLGLAHPELGCHHHSVLGLVSSIVSCFQQRWQEGLWFLSVRSMCWWGRWCCWRCPLWIAWIHLEASGSDSLACCFLHMRWWSTTVTPCLAHSVLDWGWVSLVMEIESHLWLSVFLHHRRGMNAETGRPSWRCWGPLLCALCGLRSGVFAWLVCGTSCWSESSCLLSLALHLLDAWWNSVHAGRKTHTGDC